jgi:hypothetical protein
VQQQLTRVVPGPLYCEPHHLSVDAVEDRREIHVISAVKVTHIASKMMFINKAA